MAGVLLLLAAVIAAVGLGVALLIAGRCRTGQVSPLRWSWRVFLVLLGLVLLVYSEI